MSKTRKDMDATCRRREEEGEMKREEMEREKEMEGERWEEEGGDEKGGRRKKKGMNDTKGSLR